MAPLVPWWGNNWRPWWDRPVALSIISRCDVSVHIQHGWISLFFFLMPRCEYFILFTVFSPKTLCSLALYKLRSHQPAWGQITLPEYFQCSLSPCIQVLQSPQLCMVTLPSVRHTRSFGVGRVRVCDRISEDSRSNGGGVCPLVFLQILFGWRNWLENPNVKTKSDHVGRPQFD